MKSKRTITQALNAVKPSPLLQVMPAKRVRVDPSAVDHLAAWLFAHRLRHQRALSAPDTSTSDIQRHAREKRNEYSRTALKVIADLLGRVHETVSVEDIDQGKEFVALARSELAALRDHTEPGTPTLPHTV